MKGLSWGFTSRAGHWLCAGISVPIDRGSRLMGACRFDGYDCTERGGVVYIYKKRSPDCLTMDLKRFPAKRRESEREWQLWSALYRAATAALIYSSICSPR